jgi:glycosyltransferase involved in cell wall biosynthesis
VAASRDGSSENLKVHTLDRPYTGGCARVICFIVSTVSAIFRIPVHAMRIGILSSHPIQYQAPWFRELATRATVHVYFAWKQSAKDQAAAGYGVPFEWDNDLLSGYEFTFLQNVAKNPEVRRFLGSDTPQIQDEIERRRFDAFIVCGWQLLSYWQAVLACRRHRVPVFVRGDSQLGTPRPFLKRAAKALLYPMLLKQFDGFLCVGRRNAEYLRHYGVAENKIFSAPHCVDTELFAAKSVMTHEERERIRADLSVRVEDRILLFVGRLVGFKHVSHVVDAIARLPQKDGRVHLLVVGAGPLEDSLRTQCVQFGVRATFLGFRNQSLLPRLYSIADALVLSSDESETWGLVVNEAMACGTVAIVSDAAGCAADLIAPGRTGEVYPSGNIHALALAIERAFRHARSDATLQALREMTDQHSARRAVDGTLFAVRTVQAAIGNHCVSPY